MRNIFFSYVFCWMWPYTKVFLNCKLLNCLFWSCRTNHQHPINMDVFWNYVNRESTKNLKRTSVYTCLRDATKIRGHQYAQLVCNHHTVLCKQPTRITVFCTAKYEKGNKTKQNSNQTHLFFRPQSHFEFEAKTQHRCLTINSRTTAWLECLFHFQSKKPVASKSGNWNQ